jgi:hypothetical protein
MQQPWQGMLQESRCPSKQTAGKVGPPAERGAHANKVVQLAHDLITPACIPQPAGVSARCIRLEAKAARSLGAVCRFRCRDPAPSAASSPPLTVQRSASCSCTVLPLMHLSS